MAIRKSRNKILFIMLTLIGLASLLSLPALAAPKWPIPPDLKTIEVNGYDLAYKETGSGIPLVLIHAAVSDDRSWNANAPNFAKGYRTIAVSLRPYYPEKGK
jgi:esterase